MKLEFIAVLGILHGLGALDHIEAQAQSIAAKDVPRSCDRRR